MSSWLDKKRAHQKLLEIYYDKISSNEIVQLSDIKPGRIVVTQKGSSCEKAIPEYVIPPMVALDESGEQKEVIISIKRSHGEKFQNKLFPKILYFGMRSLSPIYCAQDQELPN